MHPKEPPLLFDQATAVDPLVPQVAAAVGRVYLIVRERTATRVVEIAEGAELVIGRAPDVEISLAEPRVSRRHAILRRRGGELIVRDVGSTNSTAVNGRLLEGSECGLRAGDVLHVGPVEIAVAIAPEWSEGASPESFGGRLEHEIARLSAQRARASVLRIAVDPRSGKATLDSMTRSLGGMTLIEERSAGEYAAIFTSQGDETAPGALMAAILRDAPAAKVSLARFPEDGTTASQLWEVCRRRAEVHGAVTAQPGTIVADPVMVDLYARVRRVAGAPTNILILGETGAGKEILAEHLHRWSPRVAGPFVRLNCASLPDSLLESELFGHERGAFTGADAKKVGYFEVAHGGTLFFDEVGEIPLAVQAKLLRALETRTITPLGGTRPRQVDVRIVCATHKNLEAESAAGRFRQDLYYRLNGFTLHLPPLRERPTELVLLAELFARTFAAAMHQPAPVFSEEARLLLARYPWPGNVRELKNAVEQAMLSADGPQLLPEHFPPALTRSAAGQGTSTGAFQAARSSGSIPIPPNDETMRDRVADMEKNSIEEALRAEGGNVTRAAMRLKVSRGSLLHKMAKYGLRR